MRDHCVTAADVRRQAAIVIEKRKAQRPPIDRSVMEQALATIMSARNPLPPEPEPEVSEEDQKLADRLAKKAERIAAIERNWTHPSLDAVKALVLAAFEVDREDFDSIHRSPHFTTPRHAFFIVAHCVSQRSLPQLGKKAGERHHTTVLHALRKYKWLIDILRAELKTTDPLEAWVKRTRQLIMAK